jgi:uncharacterized protein (DUF3820 family)
MHTDDTILTTGKYKFTRLCRVPPDYLLAVYKDKNFPDKELAEYVRENIGRIMQRKRGEVPTPELKRICEKITYLSEKDAKFVIAKARDNVQENKKPVRAYECEKCSGWHLTSIPYEKLEKIKQKTPT